MKQNRGRDCNLREERKSVEMEDVYLFKGEKC